MPELLASVDVGEVDFDGGQTNGRDGVADGIAVMGVSTGVDDQTIGPANRLVDGVNDGPLVVRLEGAHFDALVSSVGL